MGGGLRGSSEVFPIIAPPSPNTSTPNFVQGGRQNLRRASEAFPIIEEAPPSPPLLYKDAEIGVRVPD